MKTTSATGTRLIRLLPALFLAAATAGAFPPVGSDGPFRTITLKNGLEVIVIEDETVPLVTIDIVVRNGAFTEPDEFAGLSHLYEHMFFKANARYPSQQEYMTRVQQLGIVYNGYTSDELVNYFFTMPVDSLEAGMAFMADAITSPRFTNDELVRERSVVLGEFDRNEAQPTFVLRYALDSAVWNPYVSRKQPLGQRKVINTATEEQMRMIQQRFYVPNNSALIVSGAVDAEEVFRLAETYLAGWERGSNPFPTYNPPSFPALQSKLVLRPADVPNPLLRMVWHGPSVTVDEPDPYIADILFTMVNQPTSRISTKLVDSGLVTDFYMGYQSARNTGDISMYATVVDPADVGRVVSILKDELRQMSKPGYFTEEDLGLAKQIMSDARIFEREDLYSYTIRTVPFWWSVAGSLDYYNNLIPNMNRVTLPQTREFITEYVVGQPFILGVGAPGESLANLDLTEGALTW